MESTLSIFFYSLFVLKYTQRMQNCGSCFHVLKAYDISNTLRIVGGQGNHNKFLLKIVRGISESNLWFEENLKHRNRR